MQNDICNLENKEQKHNTKKSILEDYITTALHQLLLQQNIS